MPAPKTKKKKKKKKKVEDDDEEKKEGEDGASPEGSPAKKKKKKKKGKKKKSSLPEPAVTLYGPRQTCEDAMLETHSWQLNNIISRKQAVGVMTTTCHTERARTFEEMNPIGRRSGVLPQRLYVGKEPDTRDYVRRVVRQLDDIEFSDDEDPEEIRNLRR
jgi:FtsZ-interacting cell division protein YlmF